MTESDFLREHQIYSGMNLNLSLSFFSIDSDAEDLVIVNQAKRLQAKKLISFDRKLQNRFPGFVVASIESQD